MMKKTLSLMLVLFGFLFLLGCTKQNGAASSLQQDLSQRKTYTHAQYGFSLQFPPSRTVKENVYQSLVMFFSPLTGDDRIQENVGVMQSSSNKEYTLAEYAGLSKPALIKAIPGFVELSSGSVKIAGQDGRKTIYKGTSGEKTLKGEQIIFIKNKDVYIITYAATEGTFDEHVKEADQIAASFKTNE